MTEFDSIHFHNRHNRKGDYSAQHAAKLVDLAQGADFMADNCPNCRACIEITAAVVIRMAAEHATGATLRINIADGTRLEITVKTVERKKT